MDQTENVFWDLVTYSQKLQSSNFISTLNTDGERIEYQVSEVWIVIFELFTTWFLHFRILNQIFGPIIIGCQIQLEITLNLKPYSYCLKIWDSELGIGETMWWTAYLLSCHQKISYILSLLESKQHINGGCESLVNHSNFHKKWKSVRNFMFWL